MADSTPFWHRPRFWVFFIALIILLIFLYYFKPFADYISANLKNARFHNVIFWFSALVAVIAFVISHWQSFKRHILRANGEVNVEGLVFDTLQISIMTVVILCAGAVLQSVELLSEHLLLREVAVQQTFGGRILTILLLIVLAIVFYLLHLVVRAFRIGWKPSRPPRRMPSPSGHG